MLFEALDWSINCLVSCILTSKISATYIGYYLYDRKTNCLCFIIQSKIQHLYSPLNRAYSNRKASLQDSQNSTKGKSFCFSKVKGIVLQIF